jgi:prepilin-type N-terminal cleavage/methylation domain-containing protein
MRVTRAFTLVELAVALAISAVLATALYELLAQGRAVGERLGGRGGSSQEARIKARRMSNEIQEGSRLFYPRPGVTADGVGFVNARGETILYFVEGSALKRANLNAPRDPPEELVRGVQHFRATTALASPGRAPARVNLDLSVAASADAPEANVVTSVFLRALERYVPEDPVEDR